MDRRVARLRLSSMHVRCEFVCEYVHVSLNPTGRWFSLPSHPREIIVIKPACIHHIYVTGSRERWVGILLSFPSSAHYEKCHGTSHDAQSSGKYRMILIIIALEGRTVHCTNPPPFLLLELISRLSVLLWICIARASFSNRLVWHMRTLLLDAHLNRACVCAVFGR